MTKSSDINGLAHNATTSDDVRNSSVHLCTQGAAYAADEPETEVREARSTPLDVAHSGPEDPTCQAAAGVTIAVELGDLGGVHESLSIWFGALLGEDDYEDAVSLVFGLLDDLVSKALEKNTVEHLERARVLDDWTRLWALARWIRRGRPNPECSSVAEYDWSCAERALACRIARQLLGSSLMPCPATQLLDPGSQVLSPTRLRYLSMLTIHDLAEEQAFWRWTAHRKERRGNGSRDVEDYLNSLNWIRRAVAGEATSTNTCAPPLCARNCVRVIDQYRAATHNGQQRAITNDLWRDAHSLTIPELLVYSCAMRQAETSPETLRAGEPATN